MKTYTAIAILVLVTISLSASVWAAPVTEGLTGVSVSIPTAKTMDLGVNLFWYEFTVYNFTSSNELPGAIDVGWDALISDFNIYGTNLQLDPVGQRAAADWQWTGQGWNNDRIFYKDDVNGPAYTAPPWIAPGGKLAGFKLGFDELLIMPPAEFSFQTHLRPINEYQNGPLYTHFTGTTPGGRGNGNTWWDKPGTVDEHTSGGDVPEASAVMLGSLGLLGPLGYALKKRASK